MTSDLGATLEEPTPPVSVQEAADLARTYYGVDGTVEPLTGERDRNFHVRETSGASWVLKVGHPAESAELSSLQTDVLVHLAQHGAALAVPRLRQTLDGENEVLWVPREVGQAASPSRVRLYSYLPGVPLHRAPGTPWLRRDLGRILGEVDRALETFDHPAANHDLVWDASRASRIAHLVDPADTQVLRLLAHVQEHTVPLLTGVRHQVIHNDANPHNVMTDEAGRKVAGLIDFGDVIRAPLPQELATASAYQLVDGTQGLEACLDVLHGYQAANPLTPEEAATVFDLMVARLVLIVVVTDWRAKQHPRNRDYILRNHRRARLGLERAAAIGCQAATTTILDALEERG